MYEGIQTEIVNTTRFDENSDLSMTDLSTSDRAKSDKTQGRRIIPHIRIRLLLCKVVGGILYLFCPIYFNICAIYLFFFVFHLGIIDMYITHI